MSHCVTERRQEEETLSIFVHNSLGTVEVRGIYIVVFVSHHMVHCVLLLLFVKVWLTLADQYLHSISIDWDKTLRFAFNERSNPDDDSLGIQIVKVTRTGFLHCGCDGGGRAHSMCRGGCVVVVCVLTQQFQCTEWTTQRFSTLKLMQTETV